MRKRESDALAKAELGLDGEGDEDDGSSLLSLPDGPLSSPPGLTVAASRRASSLLHAYASHPRPASAALVLVPADDGAYKAAKRKKSAPPPVKRQPPPPLHPFGGLKWD